MKTCLNTFKNTSARVGKGLQGPLNGLEVNRNRLKPSLKWQVFYFLQCAFECVLNATNALNNNVPNAQVLTEKATTILASEPVWIPVVTAGINYCVAQVTANATKLKTSLKGDQVNGKTICSPTSAFLVGCMFTYEFRNCPTSMWNADDTKCNELKAYFNQCPTPQIN